MVLAALGESLATFISQPELIIYLVIGTLMGLTFGALPGMSSITGMALVLPFTYGMNPLAAMLIYAGIISTSPLGGSLPAILLNTPGTGGNAATCFDAFPMTQNGEGKRAITISAVSCFIGTFFGVVVLLLLLNIIIPVLLKFRAPEIFWLIIVGLTVISFVVRENVLSGLVSAGIGLLLALVGFNDLFGVPMYAGDSFYLWDGIPLVPFYIGIFALSEVIIYTARGGTIRKKASETEAHDEAHESSQSWKHQVGQGIMDVVRNPLLVFQSSVIGTLIGIVPGVGGSVSAFISYASAKQISKHPEEFGKGSPEGIIACEIANDAKEGGSLLPTAAFGIPGSADMAIVLGAFVLHGLEPGPLLLRDHLDVVLVLAIGMTFAQAIGSVLVLFSANFIAKLVNVQTRLIAPIIIILCLAGAYSIRSNIWDVFLCVGAGLFGYLFKKYKFPIIPLAIGYILGGLAEKSFHQSLMMNYESYAIFYSSPICVVLIGIMAFMLLSPLMKKTLNKYSHVFNKKS